MESQNEWMPEAAAPTDIGAMDALIIKLRDARRSYDAAKKVSSEEYQKLEAVELDVMNALKSNRRTKFEAEGVALVYITSKEVYTTPKSHEAKAALFDYIKNKYSIEALLGMQSINYQTLNSWANKEVESDPALQIPGLDAPTTTETLTFRSKA